MIKVINAFQTDPVAYVQTHGLASLPEMTKFNSVQKGHILEIISILLTLKNPSSSGYLTLSTSPLIMANDLGRFVRVQVPFECGEINCSEEGYLGCSTCDSTKFIIQYHEESWVLECTEHRRRRAGCAVPCEGQCDQGHSFILDEEALTGGVELLPSEDLIVVISSVVNNYLAGYDFDPTQENFVIRGSNLIYYVNSNSSASGSDSAKTVIHVTQNIGIVKGGEVTGVRVDELRAT